MKRKNVYKAIDSERDYQDSKWGDTLCEGKHSPTEYMVYIQDYLQEAMNVVSRVADPEGSAHAMHIIRKITAMGVACGEQNGMPEREDRG